MMRVPLEAPTTILREHSDLSLTDTHTQTDRQTDTHRHIYRQTDRQTDSVPVMMRVPLEAPTTILQEHSDLSLTDTHTDTHTDRQTQTDIQTDRQTERQCTCDDASSVGSADHHSARTRRPLTDRHTHRQTERQTDRQTDSVPVMMRVPLEAPTTILREHGDLSLYITVGTIELRGRFPGAIPLFWSETSFTNVLFFIIHH